MEISVVREEKRNLVSFYNSMFLFLLYLRQLMLLCHVSLAFAAWALRKNNKTRRILLSRRIDSYRFYSTMLWTGEIKGIGQCLLMLLFRAVPSECSVPAAKSNISSQVRGHKQQFKALTNAIMQDKITTAQFRALYPELTWDESLSLWMREWGSF